MIGEANTAFEALLATKPSASALADWLAAAALPPGVLGDDAACERGKHLAGMRGRRRVVASGALVLGAHLSNGPKRERHVDRATLLATSVLGCSVFWASGRMDEFGVMGHGQCPRPESCHSWNGAATPLCAAGRCARSRRCCPASGVFVCPFVAVPRSSSRWP